jgi:hypothetical protein
VTAFPADAESNLFESPYPEYFQALAHCAYPGDVRRIREAHSGWSEPREYPPLYDVQCGWDAPKTGKAFKILWLKCEGESVRAWRRRRAQDWTMLDPYERIDPNEFRMRREEAERRMRLPPRQRIPMVEGYQLVGEPPLGEAVGPQIPERDSFLILRANEAFLQVIVVSHEDVSKICASAAPLPPAKSPAELGREGGKENAERIAALADIPSAAEAGRKGGWRKQALQREEKPLWHFDLVRIANAARKDDPSIFNKDIIEKVKSECDRRGIPHPEPRQMLSVLSDFITKGNIPRRKK